MSIKNWPADDRPREKLIERGAGALTDAELLAIFLRVGMTGKSAVDLAREALARFGSLTGLTRASLAEFSEIKGFGEAKFVQLQAAVELSRRALSEKLAENPVLDQPSAVEDFLKLSLGHEKTEVFMVLFLDARHRLIRAETPFRGTVSRTAVYPREIAKSALACNASSVIVAHNHPSGDVEPSPEDLHLTRNLSAALDLIEVRLVDHIIVAGSRTVSFATQNLL